MALRRLCGWHDLEVLPAAPPMITGHLSELARQGAKVGTMSRRLSAIKFATRGHEHAEAASQQGRNE